MKILLDTMTSTTPSETSRRQFLSGGLALVAGGAVLARPGTALALTENQAEKLVFALVDRVKALIAQGGSEAQLASRIEGLLNEFADVNYLARACLGAPSRQASSSELAAYTRAFSGYVARKYSKQFQNVSSGDLRVTSFRAQGSSTQEVRGVASVNGSPTDVIFFVSDRSGKPLFFELQVAGVSIRKSEQEEIGLLYDQSGRSISALTERLNSAYR